MTPKIPRGEEGEENMKELNLKRDGNTLTVTINANGYNWLFSHSRSTDADAANLMTLLMQADKADKEIEGEYMDFKNRRIARLERSNRSLRACLKKTKGTP